MPRRFPPLCLKQFSAAALRGLIGKTVGKMQHTLIIGDGASRGA
jgi:hypothetical protein